MQVAQPKHANISKPHKRLDQTSAQNPSNSEIFRKNQPADLHRKSHCSLADRRCIYLAESSINNGRDLRNLFISRSATSSHHVFLRMNEGKWAELDKISMSDSHGSKNRISRRNDNRYLRDKPAFRSCSRWVERFLEERAASHCAFAEVTSR